MNWHSIIMVYPVNTNCGKGFYGDTTVLFSVLVSICLPFLVPLLFSIQSLLYTKIYLLFMPNFITTIFYVWYRMSSA